MKLHLQAGKPALSFYPMLQRWKVHAQLFIKLYISSAYALDMLNITNKVSELEQFTA